MARLKLTLPETFSFTTEIEVLIGHVNYGGHVANDAYLSIAHEARLRFLANYGYSEENIEGCGLIMNDSAIIYKSEAFHGDCLKIEVGIDDITRIGFDLYYRISKKNSEKEIALIKTGLTFFDYQTHKIASTPAAFSGKFSG